MFLPSNIGVSCRCSPFYYSNENDLCAGEFEGSKRVQGCFQDQQAFKARDGMTSVGFPFRHSSSTSISSESRRQDLTNLITLPAAGQTKIKALNWKKTGGGQELEITKSEDDSRSKCIANLGHSALSKKGAFSWLVNNPKGQFFKLLLQGCPRICLSPKFVAPTVPILHHPFLLAIPPHPPRLSIMNHRLQDGAPQL